MTTPVFYIAEAPSITAGDIMIALAILLAVVSAFFALLIVGIKGFGALGRGKRDSVPAKIAPIIGVLDILLFVTSYDEALLLSAVPLVAHVVSFVVGKTTPPVEPPPLPTID